jgi:sigma-B regulation protein RsbU (phosphoserine phosphatase)
MEGSEALAVSAVHSVGGKLAREPIGELRGFVLAVEEELRYLLKTYTDGLRGRDAVNELEAAAIEQALMFLRGVPVLSGVRIAVRFRGARGPSGDLPVVTDLGQGKVVLVVGDVEGKGAVAALESMFLWGCIHNAGTDDRSPAPLLASLNRILSARGRRAAFCIVLLDIPSMRALIGCAGSAGPLLVRQGTTRRFDLAEPPLGMFHDSSFGEITADLDSGDVLILYSDGITDQDDQSDAMFGERFERLIEALCNEPVDAMTDAVVDELDRFAGDRPIVDDQTIIACRVL